jgi:hypothetical protein
MLRTKNKYRNTGAEKIRSRRVHAGWVARAPYRKYPNPATESSQVHKKSQLRRTTPKTRSRFRVLGNTRSEQWPMVFPIIGRWILQIKCCHNDIILLLRPRKKKLATWKETDGILVCAQSNVSFEENRAWLGWISVAAAPDPSWARVWTAAPHCLRFFFLWHTVCIVCF